MILLRKNSAVRGGKVTFSIRSGRVVGKISRLKALLLKLPPLSFWVAL
jgi:hypothetical protein